VTDEFTSLISLLSSPAPDSKIANQVSISSTFMCHLSFQFGSVIIWRKNIDAKVGLYMLMKLTIGVNFTIIL